MTPIPPPAIGPAWTSADRLVYIAWVAAITLGRIDGDDPAVPMLAKRPVRDLFHAIGSVATLQPDQLERQRAALMRPYEPAKDYHGVLVSDDLMAAIKRLAAERG